MISFIGDIHGFLMNISEQFFQESSLWNIPV